MPPSSEERYFVELSVLDLDDPELGGRQVLKLRFSLDRLDLGDLVLALRSELLESKELMEAIKGDI